MVVSKREDDKVRGMQRRIAEDPATAFRVLDVIWGRQRIEEQFTGQHMGHDGRGFTQQDAVDLNKLHDRWTDAGRKWTELRSLDVIRCQRAVKKYARQYLAHERERKAREVEESERFWRESRARVRAQGQASARERWGDSAVVE